MRRDETHVYQLTASPFVAASMVAKLALDKIPFVLESREAEHTFKVDPPHVGSLNRAFSTARGEN